MDTHEGPDTRNRLSMRRFTTLEGWREVRSGLYLVAGSTISTIIANRTYDPEWQLQDDRGAQPSLRPLVLEAIGQPVNIELGRDRQLPPAKRSSNTTEDRSDCSTQRSSFSLEEKEKLSATEAKVACSGYLERPLPETPFHSFTKKEKWLVIVTVGVAGLFSGLSSNIYFPALDTIAKDLRVSPTAVSLTITSYLVIQGISPLIWGPLSDIVGRRPIYICSFSVYIAANIVLALSPNFPVLLVFRGLQSAGSASTVSIGNGVIQDIATPIERGAFISFYQAIRNFSIAIGPVIGGLLAQYFGFRSIFLFLVTMSSIVLGVIIVFLPETLRSVAGDGSWSMSGIYQPLVGRWKTKNRQKRVSQTPISRPRVTVMSFLGPLKLLTEKDILANLIFGGTVYTVWSMVVASTTELFKQRFGLGDLTLGLIFLPNGFGTILGSMIAGKLMTRDFLNFEKDYLARNPLAPPPSKNTKDLPLDFPIEHARLRNTPYITAIFVLATGIYGITILPAEQLPVILKSGWIAVPLVLQFVIAAASNAIFAINTALVADLCPGKGASSTAINNLVRCSMGALGVAVVDSMIGSFGTAATFLGLGLTTTAMTSLLAAEWAWGMRWRSERVQVETAMAQHSAGGA